ncbi:hypothetical protein OCGS_1881 [Oceaniovalibus guishaninsula JLT2003]|uniref:Deoxyribodipyrimidine photolyase-related protein n=1 Tax=Oceaniovalibus guishaninsula JLT2003 TaxID=1231392 RepID=K2I4Q0_9RHOB|nr:hypothetical protein OCGS_1881 [Oceaniovalibus guishaninsula JLT2003]
MTRLVLVLGDQLTHGAGALARLRPGDVVVMAEAMSEASYVPHHPKKIAFLFSAMRHFADELRERGATVTYATLDDPDNTQSIPGELIRRAAEHGADEVLVTRPGEWRLIEALEDCPVPVRQVPDDRFLCGQPDFEAWAKGRRELRMEWFYRDMRRRTGLLMEGDEPAGGRWNFDTENRKPPPKEVAWPGPLRVAPDAITRDVLALVRERFPSNYYSHDDFWFAVTRADALRALHHFIDEGLARFGDFQDAMLTDEAFLYHALISPYLNAGLLTPMEVCRAAEDAWRAGRVAINAAEGFIRQILGWREFIRGVYFMEGPEYVARNRLGHDRDLPEFYWTGDTDMHCVSQCVGQTMREAYAHHIQRLMVTGNFALLAGIDPHQVHEWYLAVYADAYEWVEAPNVIGMSQFADGGVVASKPYVSSGNYIAKMSDYCRHCAYDVKTKTGQGACPFNLLYWAFLDRHRERFEGNPRMRNIYRNWDRMDADKRATVLAEVGAWLARMEGGGRV